MSEVINLVGGSDFHSEPVRLSKNLTIDLTGPARRTTSDFNSSAESFMRAIRVLMNGYALVSANDSITGRSLEAAQKHATVVENISRTGSQFGRAAHNRILEAAMQAMREWARISQGDTRYSISGVIEIASGRHSIWPIAADLRGAKDVKGWAEHRPTRMTGRVDGVRTGRGEEKATLKARPGNATSR